MQALKSISQGPLILLKEPLMLRCCTSASSEATHVVARRDQGLKMSCVSRGNRRPDFCSDSDSDLSSTSADETSNEESLGVRRQRQGQMVKRMAMQMRKLTEQELEIGKNDEECTGPKKQQSGKTLMNICRRRSTIDCARSNSDFKLGEVRC